MKKPAGKQVLFQNIAEHLVRVEGVEPTCLSASDPKSDTSANFATPAWPRNYRIFRKLWKWKP